MSEEDFSDVLKVVVKISLVVFVLMFMTKFLGYILNILIAKSFSEEVYGAYALLWSVVTLSASILLLGLPWGAARFIAYYRGRGEEDNVRDALKTSLALTLALIAVSLVFIYLILNAFPEFFSVEGNVVAYTLLLFASFALFTFFSQAITGFRKPDVANAVELTAKVVAVTSLFLLVSRGGGFECVLLSLAAGYFCAAVLGLLYCLKKHGLVGRVNASIAKPMMVFSLSVMASNATYAILTWADVFMIRFFRNLAEVGVYYAANLMSTAGLMFFGSVMVIFTPVITEFYGQGRLDKIGWLSSYLLESFLVLFTPVFLVFIAFPREILVLFFTAEYAEGALAFQMLVLTMFLFGITQVFRGILHATGKPQLEVRVVLVAAVVNVLLNLVLIKNYGITGAALSTIIANAIILAATYSYSTRIIRLHYSKKRVLKVVGACTVALLLTLQVKTMIDNPLTSLLASCITLLLSYVVVLYLLKSLRREDVSVLDAVLRKIRFPERSRQRVIDYVAWSVPK